MDFYEWRDFGVKAGWVDMPVCVTHSWFKLSDAEDAEFDDGGDPCIFASRYNENMIVDLNGGCDES